MKRLYPYVWECEIVNTYRRTGVVLSHEEAKARVAERFAAAMRDAAVKED